jgi:hypothetical protein
MKQQILAKSQTNFPLWEFPPNMVQAPISRPYEFFDAGWGTGSKRSTMRRSVFLDEQKQTAFMYEKTTETGRGLSFGSDEETSFQSGKTLFRKVKGVRYGPDGQSVEYDLDLGAIPSAVKETAKRFGWSFKTVLKKEKAMYPAGYVPAVPFASAPATPAPAAPAAAGSYPRRLPRRHGLRFRPRLRHVVLRPQRLMPVKSGPSAPTAARARSGSSLLHRLRHAGQTRLRGRFAGKIRV